MLVKWTWLKENSPIDLERVGRLYKEFQNYTDIRLESAEDLEEAKENLSYAKLYLNWMIKSLVVSFYDERIIKTKEDQVILASIQDDLGRLLNDIDQKENDMILMKESRSKYVDKVTPTRLIRFTNELKSVADTLIYESLYKALTEYIKFDEKEEEKLAEKQNRQPIQKNPRTFLYIFFKIFSINSQISGGLTRTDKGKGSQQNQQKNPALQYPTAWKAMMTNDGQEKIKQNYENQTGKNLEQSVPDLPDSSEVLFDEEEEELK